ncbi:LEA type 2 family protein [Pseudomonas sp. NW5]|uniref:LEA type 2 family protein n=1 Tax=Pseudomonas sp. NW5 TaxID=2934934 RepID=UPI0020221966|nr:LEA type 2 family protein [Pseudomonas sp. NW5]MCL7462078.1 LEA type 2 family protein [Pseudomonas sp. NW5]
MPALATFRPLLLPVLLLAIGLLPGCSLLRHTLEAPEVRLVDIELVRARLLEQQFLLHFRADNPNNVRLPIRGLSYTVYLEDKKLAHGDASQHFSIPAHGSSEFTVPVHSNLWRHLRTLMRRLEDPEQPLRYRLEGEVRTGLFGSRFSLQRSGEVTPGDYLRSKP